MPVSLQDVSEQESVVHIDVKSIPKHTQDILAAATLDLIHGILSQPGGREAIDKKITELGLS